MSDLVKNIVVIGGGSGIFNVLKGLKQYDKFTISAVVTTFDSGGSTGLLRDEFGTLPAGDIRRALVALSEDNGDQIIRDLFNYRFDSESSLCGHSFGNLFIQALSAISGSEIQAIKKAAQLLKTKGAVLPVSLDKADVCVTLEDGRVIRGETNIDHPIYDGALSIKSIFLSPKASLYKEAYDAIIKADLIVIGPGDLYTSILPNVLVEGFTDAVHESKAKVVYICNIMTKWGETHNFTASQFAKVLLHYMKKDRFDYIVCNSGKIQIEALRRYKTEKASQVKVDKENLAPLSKKLVSADVLFRDADVVRHDAKKIARIIATFLS